MTIFFNKYCRIFREEQRAQPAWLKQEENMRAGWKAGENVDTDS